MRNIGQEQLSAKAEELGEKLSAQGWFMATAESCTGGWIAQTVTAISGSSQWFDRGFVTYSNQAKIEMLGVELATIGEYGAVSGETAAEMVRGALAAARVEIAVAVTGVAGPDGGTPQKPVGTVWFGWATKNTEPVTKKMCFAGDRESIRAQTVSVAIDGLLELTAALTIAK